MKFVVIAALLAASPAFAQTAPTFTSGTGGGPTVIPDKSLYTVKLTHDEAQALLTMLDGAVKLGGLQAAKAAMSISDKLIAAGQDAQAADEAAKIKAAVDAAKAPPK